MIKPNNALILKESFEYCPYIRAIQKESRRNAAIADEDKRLENEIIEDVPEITKLKAHLKRRIERQTKNKWVQYATEYASEMALSSLNEREAMRKYLDMTKEAMMSMDHKKKQSKERKRMRNISFNEETY